MLAPNETIMLRATSEAVLRVRRERAVGLDQQPADETARRHRPGGHAPDHAGEL
jgi:hypothetical protein